MGRKNWLLVIGVGTGLIAVFGCGKKSSSSNGGGGVTLNNFGGQVYLTSSVLNGTLVTASFVSAVSPEPTPVVYPVATGNCVVGTGLNIIPLSGLGTFTEVSVGSTLTFKSGSVIIPAALTSGGGSADYSYSNAGQLPGGDVFTMANSGAAYLGAETIATIHFPQNIALTGNPVVTSSQTLTLQWTGGTGANDVEIFLQSLSTAEAADCSVANTGSFTIPANVTLAVGNAAQIAIGAESISKVTVKGRDVLLIGDNTP